jgi:hypothetical protein
MTSALGRGGWSAPRPGHFTPGKDPVPNVQEAGWAPGPVWTCAKNLAPPGFDPRTVQPVVSRYTDWATGPLNGNVLPPCSAQIQYEPSTQPHGITFQKTTHFDIVFFFGSSTKDSEFASKDGWLQSTLFYYYSTEFPNTLLYVLTVSTFCTVSSTLYTPVFHVTSSGNLCVSRNSPLCKFLKSYACPPPPRPTPTLYIFISEAWAFCWQSVCWR